MSINERVHGTLPGGTFYSANDPDMLTWVHVAGANSFLRAYLLYRNPHFDRAAQDLHFNEAAEIAFKLGAERACRTGRHECTTCHSRVSPVRLCAPASRASARLCAGR